MALVVFCAKSPNVEELKRAPDRSFRLGENYLTLNQKWKPGGSGGTLLKHGASVYDASFVLADYIFRNAGSVSGKRLLELGSGPGLGAIGAALSGAAEVVATDGDEELLSLTRLNMDLNIADPKIRNICSCERLLWGNKDDIRNLGQTFDVIIAADCVAVVYEHSFRDLIFTLERLAHEKSVIYLAYHRRHTAEDSFFEMLRDKFSCTRIASENLHPDFIISQISIFEIRKLETFF
jgi:predicted nicotinamide N-methyase